MNTHYCFQMSFGSFVESPTSASETASRNVSIILMTEWLDMVSKPKPLTSHSTVSRGVKKKRKTQARGGNRAGRHFTEPPRSESSDKWWRHLSSPRFSPHQHTNSNFNNNFTEHKICLSLRVINKMITQ